MKIDKQGHRRIKLAASKNDNKTDVKKSVIDAAIKWLTELKSNPAVREINVEVENGMRRVPQDAIFVTYEPNGTFTMTVKVNGGSRNF